MIYTDDMDMAFIAVGGHIYHIARYRIQSVINYLASVNPDTEQEAVRVLEAWLAKEPEVLWKKIQ